MLVEVNFDNLNEINKRLRFNHLIVNDEGYLTVVNNRTNTPISIVPFPDVYELNDFDLQ